MTIADWLSADRIEVPIAVDTLEEALFVLLRGLGPDAAPEPALREKAARDLAFGSRGEVVRIAGEAVVVLAEQEKLDRPRLHLGVSVDPFVVTAEGREDPGQARAVFLLMVPRGLSGARARLVPVLRRFLTTDEGRLALYAARSAEEVVANSGLLSIRLPDRTRVLSAIEPVSYRVYPHTPLAEVFELMTRRRLHAVPVVGESYEVLGIITAGDALRHLAPRARGGGDVAAAAAEGEAREIMTRTVLCVSEDQALEDVATLMVNRDVEQLPVVREGELIGFLTRDAVLRALLIPEDAAGDGEVSSSKSGTE